MCFEALTKTDLTESQKVLSAIETAASTPVKEEIVIDEDEPSDCPIYQSSSEIEGIPDFGLDCKLSQQLNHLDLTEMKQPQLKTSSSIRGLERAF